MEVSLPTQHKLFLFKSDIKKRQVLAPDGPGSLHNQPSHIKIQLTFISAKPKGLGNLNLQKQNIFLSSAKLKKR